MLSAKLVFASLFAFVASAFAAELNLKTLKGTGHNDLGLQLGWFKPLVGKELQKVRCGAHELWSTTEKEHELLVLSKCKEAAHFFFLRYLQIAGEEAAAQDSNAPNLMQ
ncbi:signal peptide-containing protein [Theileria equi strain WA]|uniref:Signal peptide-containing protein n=1 Tax=Theileria equi strain WA TaxID=1537102 RepID=L0B1J4_THEEQ|nr:signal peptide-containing protein [Theileria equi strain WA]AFZ80984.1 signal peptide-containing protein [Theileria equi strain WA]|eukprot:XP_004830650.1 signal peptide-containing protein [Theileria equi strain WA]